MPNMTPCIAILPTAMLLDVSIVGWGFNNMWPFSVKELCKMQTCFVSYDTFIKTKIQKTYYSGIRPRGRVMSSTDLSSLAWQTLAADVAYKWRNIVEWGAAGYDLILLRPERHGLYMHIWGCVHDGLYNMHVTA